MYQTNKEKIRFIQGVMNIVLEDAQKIFEATQVPYAWAYSYTVDGAGPYENVSIVKPEEDFVDGTHRFNIRPLYLG